MTNIFLNKKIMGLIREPNGVDFEVINHKMTEEERKLVSDFIRKQKVKLTKRKLRTARLGRKNSMA